MDKGTSKSFWLRQYRTNSHNLSFHADRYAACELVVSITQRCSDMSIKVTLDTNCFFDYFERTPTYIQELVELQAQGQVEIAMTTRVMVDTVDKWKGQGHSPIWSKIQSFPKLASIGSAFRLDMSRLDTEDYLISDSDAKLLAKLRVVMTEAQIEDIDHLFGHIMARRDIFITSDPHFLNHREDLKNNFGALIFRPEEAVQEIRNRKANI